jgi:Leucine-rich repeat (LRR) protein
VQSLALTWLKNNTNLQFYDSQKQLDRWALAVFYYSTNGDDWVTNTRWMSNFDECTWYAANVPSCNSDRRFANLVLGANNVVGTLPPELGLLSDSLEAINIRGISADSLSGSIPSTVGFLTGLKELNLRGNGLGRTLPSQIGNLDMLTELDVNGNNFNGTLPISLITSLPSLVTLDLGENNFTGTIQVNFGELSKLTSLVLASNQLKGTIPESISGMTSLEVLNLDDNDFEFIPKSVGTMINLKTLSASNNAIGGTIHTEFGQLVNLEGLFLSNNQLGFQIPSELGRLTKLRDGFDVSMNQLIGSVPAELGSLTELRQFRLTGNRLAGILPNSIGQLAQLRVFRIDENDLTGEVPQRLCSIFDITQPVAYADCAEISCPCCSYCCVDGEGCTCQFETTDPLRCSGSRL